MSRPFSFVHAADLHIASPFVGLTAAAPAIAERIADSTFRAFTALVDLCLEREVDFLLVAGDVYDARDRSLKAQLALRDGLTRLADAGIPSYVVHGNHDPLDGAMSELSWPEAVHIFGDRVTTEVVRSGGEAVATVSGMSYRRAKENRNLAARFEVPSDDVFHIALLHCNVGGHTGHEPYAPCELGELTGAGFDYWALGHVHRYSVLHERPWVVYPGKIQGRSFRETGPGGACLVSVRPGTGVELEYLELDRARFAETRIGIDGLGSIDELARACSRAALETVHTATGRPSLQRLVLEGRGFLDGELRQAGAIGDLLEHLRDEFADRDPPVWIQQIRVTTRPEADLDSRRQAEDLLAEVLDVAEELKEVGGDEGLDGAIAPLFDHHKLRKLVRRPEGEDLLALIEAAELSCFDLLED